jgi:peptidoglycan/LPS O-acetylase OafA/YrhL
LRVVAVYLVVLFHAGVDRFSGGFIGVDVFFVLSGYLVTQLLMRDLRRRGGGLRFGRFYARRFRRLLPASFVALIVTAIVYSAIASQAELASSLGAFKAAFLYVANWFFIHQATDYFAADVNASPVQQFWSLAVEEQFYFVWPILLAGLYAVTGRLRRHRHRVLQGVVLAAGIASLLWALRLASVNISRAYYGTDTRAYQLLAGAFVALSPGLLRRVSRLRIAWLAAPVGLLALLVLSTSLVDVNPVQRGVVAATATVVLLVGIEAFRTGPVQWLFSSGPAQYLGKVSYGTYLWHWPVIIVAVAVTDGAISPASTFALSAILATGLASLSYQILERPVREQRFLDRINVPVIAGGLAISVIAALVIIPSIVDPYSATTDTAEANTTTGFTPIPDLDFASARTDVGDLHDVRFNENCFGRPVADCTVVRGSGPHVLVIGDSHGQMVAPAFAKLAQERDLTFSTAASGGCPWQRDLYPVDRGVPSDKVFLDDCIAFKEDLYDRVIPELDPDIIVGWSNDYVTRRPGVVYDDEGPVPTRGFEDTLRQVRAETERSVDELTARGAKVLMVEPVPSADVDPFVCLTKAKVLESCRFVADPSPSPLDRIYRDVADERTVYEANFDQLLCPFMPICDPVENGTIVRIDNQHITPKFSTSLAGPIADFLQRNSLIAQ